MPRLKYYGLENYDTERDERPQRCEFFVKDTGTDEILVHFYTNKDFQGKFYRDCDGKFHTLKCCDEFTMPVSKQRARCYLKKSAESGKFRGV